MKYKISEIIYCPECYNQLLDTDIGAYCNICKNDYPYQDGILYLMNNIQTEDKLHQDYFKSYQKLATDDLKIPLVKGRESYHGPLLKFIGKRKLKGKKVVDVGSSQALYLSKVEADFKIAIDIALPFLKAIDSQYVDLRIFGDAEKIRFLPGFIDTFIISDILEHLLEPRKLIENCLYSCHAKTELIVHIPWQEDISIYKDQPYEFAHLRSFNEYNLSHLLWGFTIKKSMYSHPILDTPFFFKFIEKGMPLWLSNILKLLYFGCPKISKKEYEWRAKAILELPKRSWWLKKLYKPAFRTLKFVKTQQPWILIQFLLRKFKNV